MLAGELGFCVFFLQFIKSVVMCVVIGFEQWVSLGCGGVSSGFDRGNGGRVWVVNSQLLLRQWLCGFAVALKVCGFVLPVCGGNI